MEEKTIIYKGQKGKFIPFDEPEYIKVPELGIEITPKQKFNGKRYSEILNEVNESEIATYEILQKLRNIAFESNWKKYPFMKNAWVFVPNPDEVSKKNGHVARFVMYSDYAGLNGGLSSGVSVSSLGVFLFRKLKEKRK